MLFANVFITEEFDGFQLERNLAFSISMTACDLCASSKPWHVQLETVKVIFEEFYAQVKYCLIWYWLQKHYIMGIEYIVPNA